MASITLKIKDLEILLDQMRAKELNTAIFTSSGTIYGNNSNGSSRLGVHIGDLPFKLIDDPNERSYWPEVRHKFVITKSYTPSRIEMRKRA